MQTQGQNVYIDASNLYKRPHMCVYNGCSLFLLQTVQMIFHKRSISAWKVTITTIYSHSSIGRNVVYSQWNSGLGRELQTYGQSSRSTDRTRDRCEPKFLWTPEHSIQNSMPRFNDAHSGSKQKFKTSIDMKYNLVITAMGDMVSIISYYRDGRQG